VVGFRLIPVGSVGLTSKLTVPVKFVAVNCTGAIGERSTASTVLVEGEIDGVAAAGLDVVGAAVSVGLGVALALTVAVGVTVDSEFEAA
jgi:hypothetical protein